VVEANIKQINEILDENLRRFFSRSTSFQRSALKFPNHFYRCKIFL